MQEQEKIQSSFEQRFNCMICLCPRLHMVSGYCQHRICADCLYDGDNIRKPSMDKCPTCQREEAFPVIKPGIPDDNVEIQKCLGVRACTNEGCPVELWEWELKEHLTVCPKREPSPKPIISSSQKMKRTRRSMIDNGDAKLARVTRSHSFSVQLTNTSTPSNRVTRQLSRTRFQRQLQQNL